MHSRSANADCSQISIRWCRLQLAAGCGTFCCSRMMCCALSLRRIDRAEMLCPSSGRDGTRERAPVEDLTRSNAARISRRLQSELATLDDFEDDSRDEQHRCCKTLNEKAVARCRRSRANAVAARRVSYAVSARRAIFTGVRSVGPCGRAVDGAGAAAEYFSSADSAVIFGSDTRARRDLARPDRGTV